MPAQQYPFVLTDRLGKDTYESLIEMVEDRRDERLMDLEHRLDTRFTDLERSLDGRFGGIDRQFIELERRLDARFAAIDERFVGIGAKFEIVDAQFAAVDEKLSALGERFEKRLIQEIGGVRTEMAQQRADLLKWAMLFWVSEAAAVAGIVTVLR